MSTIRVHTSVTPHLRIQRIPALVPDVARLKVSVNLYDAATIEHPALLDLYKEMLLRGTKTMNRMKLTESIEEIGASITMDVDGYTLDIGLLATKRHLPRALSLLTDILSSPAFTGAEIGKAKKQLAQTYHEELDDAKAQAYIRFARTLYPKAHPYHVSTSQEDQHDVATLTRVHLNRVHALLHQRVWEASVLARPAEQKKVVLALEKCHRKKKSADTPPHAAIISQNAAKEIFTTVPGKQNIDLYIGNTLPCTLTDREYLAFSLGLDILGKRGGFVGRLMQTVREKEGLTYGIYAYVTGATKTTSGHWNIWTFFTGRDLDQGLSSTIREVTKIHTRGVTDVEIARMKELIRNQFLMAHGAGASLLSLYHGAEKAGLSAEELQERLTVLQSLSKKEINAALKNHLHPGRLVISGAGPVAKNGTPLEK